MIMRLVLLREKRIKDFEKKKTREKIKTNLYIFKNKILKKTIFMNIFFVRKSCHNDVLQIYLKFIIATQNKQGGILKV